MRSDGARRRRRSLDDLELAHDRMHVAALRGLSEDWPSRTGRRRSGAQIDPDTAMNVHTWNAVLRAAGAASPPPMR
jgi:acetoin utilization deacetylase AcuC-like enzyme